MIPVSQSKKIAIIGGGSWGLAIAKLLDENKHQVVVWEHNSLYVEQLQSSRTNPVLLPHVRFASSITFTNAFADVISHRPQHIIFATPSQYLRSTLETFQDQVMILSPTFWVSAELSSIINLAKGIEEHSLMRMSELIASILPTGITSKLCSLSGPSHAEEVCKQIPTTVVIAGSDHDLLLDLQNIFSNGYFRVYRSLDLIGVEIGGAVKNVIAIAAGIVDGLGMGDNTKGALLTRGIAEIKRLGVVLGADPDTFLGLSGIGDLITTAISSHSRNLYVGREIGKGRTLPDILADMKMVAEGVSSTRSVYELARKHQVEMPITTQIYEVLYLLKSPLDAIKCLMGRDLKAENR